MNTIEQARKVSERMRLYPSGKNEIEIADTIDALIAELERLRDIARDAANAATNHQAKVLQLQAELESLKSQEPVAYLYHDAASAKQANSLMNSTLLFLAADRAPNHRNETPLYLAAGAQPYDQQALELCDKCGWKAVIPGEPCLVCERNEKMLAAGVQDRKPLPIERLRMILRQHVYSQSDTLIAFARAIEAAHGIKEQP